MKQKSAYNQFLTSDLKLKGSSYKSGQKASKKYKVMSDDWEDLAIDDFHDFHFCRGISKSISCNQLKPIRIIFFRFQCQFKQ